MSSRDIKGHFYPMKIYKRAPLIWATPMFIAYLNCFLQNKFFMKINHRGHRPKAGPSMNILHTGDKLPVQRGFFTNSSGDLLPTLGFLGRLYNFCNLVIIFSLIKVTMICRSSDIFYRFGNATNFEYYHKTCSRNRSLRKLKTT